jgi:hypothetical protein
LRQVYLTQNFLTNRKTFVVLIEIQSVRKNHIILQAFQTLSTVSFDRIVYYLIYLNYLEPYQSR